MVVIAGVSLVTSAQDDDPKAVILLAKTFKTGPAFNISAYAIMTILVVLYAIFW
jgi:SSS family solute:Na+ symporter